MLQQYFQIFGIGICEVIRIYMISQSIESDTGRKTTKYQWPPHSPDLNPLDYYFWNEIQNKVFEGRRKPFANIEELTARINEAWESACDPEKLHRAIMQFRPRLLAVVKEEGGPIKHLFK